jgi:tetratricopeptide (TPR) repeat protein
VLRIAGRYDKSLAALEEASRLYHATCNFEGEAQTVATIGIVHAFRGTRDEGLARVRAVVDAQAGREPSSGLAALHGALSRLLWNTQNFPQILAAAERGSEIARAVGDDRALALIQSMRGAAHRVLGHWEEAEAILTEAVPLAEVAGDPNTLFIALRCREDLHFFAGRFQRAREQVERDLAVIDKMGNQGWSAFTLAFLGWTCYYAGDWQQARVHLERAVELSRSAGESWHSALPLLALGELCVAEGRWEEASQHLEDRLAMAERTQDFQWEELARCLLAELAIQQGRPEAALARFQPLFDHAQTDPYISYIPWYVVSAWVHLELGETSDAAAGMARLGQAVETDRSPFSRAGWEWMTGMVLARQERWEEAQHAFDEAVALARSLPYPYLEARAQYEWGRTLIDQERAHAGAEKESLSAPRDRERLLEEGRQRLKDACLIFERLGARPYLERAQQASSLVAMS